MSAEEGTTRKQGRCTARRCYCCYCTGCCCVLLALGVAVAVIASSFEEPDVEVKSARLTGVSAASASSATLHAEVTILLDNPNGWPITGSMDKLTVDIWSLDKEDEHESAIYVGAASLPEPVVVETESETTFDVSADVNVAASPDSATLLARFARDCGPLATTKETMLRFKIKDPALKVVDVPVDLAGVDLPVIDMAVPCE